MENLRNFLKGWVGKVLLALFLLPLAITGFDSIVRSTQNPNEAVKVGQQSIDNQVLQNNINQTRQSLLAQLNGDASLINETSLHDRVLQGLIDRYLILDSSNQLGFSVSDTLITQLLATDPDFAGADGKFSNEIFSNYLRQRGLTKEQLFDLLRQDLVVANFSSGIVNTAIYPSQAVDNLISLQSESRPLWIARLNWRDFLDKVQVNETEISSYYQKNQSNLKSSEMVDVSYIELDKNAITIDIPTDKEIDEQYQQYLVKSNNQTEYEVAMILVNGENAENTLNDLKKQLDTGADFATLAKQHSQDVGSKDNGGNIGTLEVGMFPQDFQKIVDSVKGLQEGQVTNPIQTSYGYHLFKLVKVHGANPPSLESVKPLLVDEINKQKRENQYQELIGKINNDAVAGASIDEIASRYHLSTKVIKDYPKTNNTTAINQPAIINAVFDKLALQEGSVSVGTELNQKTVWTQSSNYRTVKNLDQKEATPLIQTKLTEEKAKALALQEAQNLVKQINDSNSFKNLGVNFQELGETTRQNPLLLAEERSIAFSQNAEASKVVAVAQANSQGASVIVGGTINKNALPITDDIRQQTANMVRDNIGQSQFEDYLDYLRSTTEIVINPQFKQATTVH